MTEAQLIHEGWQQWTDQLMMLRAAPLYAVPNRGESCVECAKRTGLPALWVELDAYVWPDGLVTSDPIKV